MFPCVRVDGGNALAVCSIVAPTMVLSVVLSYYTMVLSYMCFLLKCSLRGKQLVRSIKFVPCSHPFTHLISRPLLLAPTNSIHSPPSEEYVFKMRKTRVQQSLISFDASIMQSV